MCWTVDCLLQGFCCSKCNSNFICNLNEQQAPIIHRSGMHGADADFSLDCTFIQLQSLFFELLFDESSEDVQISCVRVIHRILAHGASDILLKTRFEWIKCVEFLLTSRSKELREVQKIKIAVE